MTRPFCDKKLLVLGASILQVPIIQKARQLGFHVAAADFNNKAVGIEFCDEFFHVSTTDVEGVSQIVERFNPAGVVTAAADMPVRVIAHVCERFNLEGPSVETAMKATDKALMIEAFSKHHVPSPKYFVASDVVELNKKLERLGFPCILKPVDSSGSRGVVLVNSPDELETAFAYSKSMSRDGKVIVEEVLVGNEISVEAICLNGKANVLAITDKTTTGSPHFVETSHMQPANLANEMRDAVCGVVQQAVEAIGIVNGPAHIEIMCTQDGPKLIELGHRLGGDFITSHLVPLSTGIDMLAATILLACGIAPDLEPKFHKASAVRFFSAPEGMLKNVKGIESAKAVSDIKDVILFKTSGRCPARLTSSIDRVGAAIAQANDGIQVEQACRNAIDFIEFEMEESSCPRRS